MLELIGKATSINVRKVLWTLDELGLEYRRRDIGEGVEDVDAGQWRALNPNGLVPVLREGDFVLWESNTICRYLAGRAARMDLLPAEPRARARVEQWMDWQATGLNDAWRYAFMARVRQSPLHKDPDAIERSIASWSQHMAVLDQQPAATGAYVAGDIHPRRRGDRPVGAALAAIADRAPGPGGSGRLFCPPAATPGLSSPR